MRKFYLGPRSHLRLMGVHPDLVAVVKHCISKQVTMDFGVVCGLRSLARQHELVKAGASKTMHSRHLTGHAVDLAPYIAGKIVWNTKPFYTLEGLMKTSAYILDVPLEWGGDFNNRGTTGSGWVDLPHFQLPRGLYHDDSKHHLSVKAKAFLDGK